MMFLGGNGMLISFILFVLCFMFPFYFLFTIIMIIQQQKKPQSLNQSESPDYNNVLLTEMCHICEDRVKNKIVLTCEHTFCGLCVKSRIQNYNNNIECPICHKISNIVMFNDIIHNESTKEIITFFVFYNTINTKGIKYITSLFNNIHFIFKCSIEEKLNNTKQTYLFLLSCLVCLLYFLFPYDIIYYNILVYGYIDDMIIFVFLYLYVLIRYYNRFIEENQKLIKENK